MALHRRQLVATGLAAIAAPTTAQARMPRDFGKQEPGMLNTLIATISSSTVAQDDHRLRRGIYENELGAVNRRFAAIDAAGIEVLGFERDFAPVGAADVGYVLLTNGMSDRRMKMPPRAHSIGGKSRAELMWYVRAPTEEIIATMRWLAEFPFIDETWLSFGHRIPMPEPPLKGCDFKTFLFLTPVIEPDKKIAAALSIDGEPVEILTVNLISHAEYALIKAAGLNPFLDLLDENDYPPIFDPKRESYLR